MTECKIDLSVALTLQELIKKAGGADPPKGLFRCPKCGKPVFPQGGENQRFNHWEANPRCSG